jgi:hypothetical protein
MAAALRYISELIIFRTSLLTPSSALPLNPPKGTITALSGRKGHTGFSYSPFRELGGYQNRLFASYSSYPRKFFSFHIFKHRTTAS